jgi:hypothetical protein
MIKIISVPFVVSLVMVSIASLVGIYRSWSRWPARWAPFARIVSMLLVMTMGAVIAGAEINREYGFYASLSDLLGQPTPTGYSLVTMTGPPPGSGVLVHTRNWEFSGRQLAATHRGIVLDVTYPGPHSRLSLRGELYLPAAYFDSGPARGFGAVEFLHGYPGTAAFTQRWMALGSRLDTEINAGRIPPVVVAMPQIYRGCSPPAAIIRRWPRPRECPRP